VGIAFRSGAAGASGVDSAARDSATGTDSALAWSSWSLSCASADAMAAFNAPTVREASAMSRSSVDTIARSSPVSIRDG
jgi:hypothetical protein